MAQTAKRLRSIRIHDLVWSAMGAYAKAEGCDRTKLIERWAVESIPAEHWPTADLPEGQASIFELLDDDAAAV